MKQTVVNLLIAAEDDITAALKLPQYLKVKQFHEISVLRTKLIELRKEIERGTK